MEKRVILALLLCGLVLMVHMVFVAPLLGPKRTPGVPGGTSVPGGPSTDNGTVSPPPPSVTPVPAPTPTPAPAPVTPPPTPAAAVETYVAENVTSDNRSYKVGNGLITSYWTDRFTGACDNVTFDDFYTTVDRKQKLTLIGGFNSIVTGVPEELEPRPKAMVLEFPEMQKALSDMTMRVVRADDNGIVFSGKILVRDAATNRYSDCLEVTKRVRAPRDKYEIEVEVGLKNLTGGPLALKYGVRALDGITVEPTSVKGAAGAADYLTNGNSIVITRSEKGFPIQQAKSLRPPGAGCTANNRIADPWQEGAGNVLAAGIQDRYFAALVFADGFQTMDSAAMEPVRVRILPKAAPVDTFRVTLANHVASLAPGAVETRKFHLFVGPKQAAVLDAYENLGLPRLVDFGWFGPIAVLLVWILRAFYAVVRNYGVAIVLLTALTRVLLHPLTRKGQVAMYRMQKLQPKIKELQQKHKNDKQKLGAEQMKLFREHGVSPFSGCLPMLLQMPILFALFYALRQTFEMRQSPFCWWMTDLSLPDTVGYFPPGVPFLAGVALNILPLLMTVAMYFQQKMTPKSDDPQARSQQKMMAFMPFLFAFMFYTMPAGLCLYWFTSTVLGMAEQYLIKRHLIKLGALAAPVKVGK